MWLIKSEEGTDMNYGKPPKDRTVKELLNTSLIIVDKHSGPTSHQITAWLRNVFNLKLAGHSGTLVYN